MPVLYTVCEYKKVKNCSIKANVYPVKDSPVLIYIHGGCCINGSRNGLPYDYQLNALLSSGISVVSIDYRLAPETKLKFIIGDIQDALDWVRGEGAEIFGFDPKRVAVMGGSAGGYLALVSGTLENKPNVIISYYGYGDILGDWYTKPDKFYLKQPAVTEEQAYKLVGREEISEAIIRRGDFYLYARQNGLWPTLVSGYDQNTEREKIIPLSPIYNIKSNYPPTILLHGDKDEDVPVEQSILMYNALKDKGIETELLICCYGFHTFDKSDKPEIQMMFKKALDFLKRYI